MINVAFLSVINLVSDCGCKGEDNKIVTMLCDKMLYIYKTVKPWSSETARAWGGSKGGKW